ncbi:MAG: hypothetical protein RSD40_06860 [Bacilli bacterium]
MLKSFVGFSIVILGGCSSFDLQKNSSQEKDIKLDVPSNSVEPEILKPEPIPFFYNQAKVEKD